MKNKQKARRRCAWLGAVLLCILAILPLFVIPAGAEETDPGGPLTESEDPLLSFSFNLAAGVPLRTPARSDGSVFNPISDTTLPTYYLTGRDAAIQCRIKTTGYFGETPQSEYCTIWASSDSGAVCGINVSVVGEELRQTFLVNANFRYCVWGKNFEVNDPSEISFVRQFDEARITLGSFSTSEVQTKTTGGNARLKLYRNNMLVSEYALLDFTAYYYLNSYFRCYSETLLSVNSDASGAKPFVTISSPALLKSFTNGRVSGYSNGYSDAQKAFYQKGYDTGYSAAEAKHANDYSNGLAKGRTDALNGTSSLKDMIFAIFSAPSDLINGILDFDLFGINLATLVKTLITLTVTALIVVFLVKLMRR